MYVCVTNQQETGTEKVYPDIKSSPASGAVRNHLSRTHRLTACQRQMDR